MKSFPLNTTNNMKTRIITTMPTGYGHQRIAIEYRDGKIYDATINNMSLFDAYKSDTHTLKQEKDQRRAEKDLIRLVKSANGLL